MAILLSLFTHFNLIKSYHNISTHSFLYVTSTLKEWPRQYQFLSIYNFEVLAGHRKSFEEKFSLIALFCFEFCVANVQLTKRVFLFFSYITGAMEFMM